MKKILTLGLLVLVTMFSLSACDVLANADVDAGTILGSGQIAARTVSVSPEIGGKAVEVLAQEGDPVEAGDKLIQFDDEIYQAQYNQAAAAVSLAEAAVETQKAQLEAALINFGLASQGARFRDQSVRNLAWQVPQVDEFFLPVWYFEKDESMTALEIELEASEAHHKTELENLENELAEASNADLLAADQRLATARAAYIVAQQTLTQMLSAQDNEKLEEIAQENVDAALSELESAQLDYDRMLSTAAYDDLIDARGRVAVARSRRDAARDQLDQMYTGEDSLEVEAAWAVVQQAEAGVFQAEAALDQTIAALETLGVQISKTVVYAPTSGVILARNLEVGEVVGPGSSSMVIGDLDIVELTVYIPEDRYGQVDLGQDASITVDSFPGETFDGTVIRIADGAEFTPRNVQTVDGRKSTVYAVVIQVPNAEWKLKPGMPADAVIDVTE